MTINEKSLKEFIAIYKKNFGTELSEKEALDLAIPLLTMGKHILLPNVAILGKK